MIWIHNISQCQRVTTNILNMDPSTYNTPVENTTLGSPLMVVVVVASTTEHNALL